MMKKNKSKAMTKYALLICVLGSLLSYAPATAQEVWPGDVNNNGIVSPVDLLYWGFAHGNAGPPRNEESTDWSAQSLDELWGQTFPGGIDFAYADCDGNGFIDEDDFDDAIEDNFGLTHGTVSPDQYSNGSPGIAPRLVMDVSDSLVQEGATVTISLWLDDSDMPIDNFYGLAFTMSYTTGLLEDDDGPDFDLTENNWIEAADDSYVQDLYYENDGLGDAAFGITRTNQVSIPAEPGMIGNFSVVIEDIIVGLTVDTFLLQIDSVRLISDQLVSIPVVPDTAMIVITSKPLGEEKPAIPLKFRTTTTIAQAVDVFPNPAKDHFFIRSPITFEDMFLVDYLGREIPLRKNSIEGGLLRYNLPALTPGIYGIRMENQHLTVTKKLIITN
jgi:hypothetical protein